MASKGLARSKSLQQQFDSLTGQLSGTEISARRDANAQLMALQAAKNQLRVGSQTIVHSQGITADQVQRIVTEVVQQIPSRDIYMDSEKVGHRVAAPVARQHPDDYRRASTRPF
ncbi:hypothetical protein [Branchiibius hedensis]|uniref:hypothetical protein n=1 Tax=Branchiibius hedensis TaxID=672460 RepID=UPI0011B1D21F|nr:hypothetical protein [Branchiibius hedensis]